MLSSSLAHNHFFPAGWIFSSKQRPKHETLFFTWNRCIKKRAFFYLGHTNFHWFFREFDDDVVYEGIPKQSANLTEKSNFTVFLALPAMPNRHLVLENAEKATFVAGSFVLFVTPLFLSKILEPWKNKRQGYKVKFSVL